MIKNLSPRLAESGKIKIGGLGAERTSSKGGTYRLPQKHDYFTITTVQRTEAGDLEIDEEMMHALAAASYADRDGKVRRLPIVLHSDEIDEVFPTAYVAYHGKIMFCRGDGETAMRREIKNGEWTGAEKERTCPCEYLEENERGERRCKPNGALHCSIALPERAIAGAVHRWRTTSIISINYMIASLVQVRDKVVGTLQGVPLVLIVSPLQVAPKGKPITVYVCHVELQAADLSAVQRDAIAAVQARNQLAAAMGRNEVSAQYRAMLQAPGADDDDDVQPEYYPDEVIGSTPAGAAVTHQSQAPVPMTDPLASLLEPRSYPATDQPTPADVNDELARPPSRPAPPPPADSDDAGKRTRRTKCTGCGELWGPGIVVKGLCEQCRNPPPPAEPDPAPEIGPPAPGPTPYERIAAAYKDAIQVRGVPSTTVSEAMAKAWPDYLARKPPDWTDADADNAEAIIGGLQP